MEVGGSGVVGIVQRRLRKDDAVNTVRDEQEIVSKATKIGLHTR